MEELSPMMKQYFLLKEQYKTELLFFRLGDFYEMFFEDAITASRELEIVLTERACGGNKKAPMCGVPFHSADAYISRLLAKGFKVAICEQMSEPQKGKSIVERQIVRVVTAGTIVEENSLSRERNNYLCCVYFGGENMAAAWADISTGELAYSACDSMQSLNELLSRIEPSEIICNAEMQVRSINLSTVKFGVVCPFSLFDESAFDDNNARDIIIDQYGESFLNALSGKGGKEGKNRLTETNFISSSTNPALSNNNAESGKAPVSGRNFGDNYSDSTDLFALANAPTTATANTNASGGKKECVNAVGALLKYIVFTQKKRLLHLNPAYSDECSRMILDANARRNLEIFSVAADGKKRGSLLWVLDRTKTAMGARMLRSWLESPLLDENLINQRQDAVSELVEDIRLRGEELSAILSSVMRDIERIVGRLSCGNISPRDCFTLGDSLSCLPKVKSLLEGLQAPLFKTLNEDISGHEELSTLITCAIKPDPAPNIKEGGVINAGFDEDLDKFMLCRDDALAVTEDFERMEREVTGIKNLKVGFNRVIGYYIEVTKANLGSVPYRYERKGSTINSERYITQELKQYEEEVLAAEGSAVAREAELYAAVLERARNEVDEIQKTARAVARLDCLLSLATAARENRYVRPAIGAHISHIKISEGRHPVVEKLSREPFVPNDTLLDAGESKIMVITGPNMAGKSIYMRQVALMAVMAQVGSFVPAASAEFCITDKIFTRIGAGDDLKTGRSTFMVEMNECQSILLSSTPNSLILLDEVGRGTATYDGMSIAYAILKYITTKIGAKTLFATHYHELTELEGVLPGLKNISMGVRELDGDIIFLRKILKGAAGKSYGIEVARLAGLPEEVVEDARQILKHLESQSLAVSVLGKKKAADLDSNIIKESPCENPVLTKLKTIDTDLISPMEALNLLVSLKKEANKQCT